jgi:hypothetical protein
MPTRPAGSDKAPNLVVLVQSSLRGLAMAITAPRGDLDVGPLDREFRHFRVVRSLDRAADDFSQIRACPPRLQQQIASAAGRLQPV